MPTNIVHAAIERKLISILIIKGYPDLVNLDYVLNLEGKFTYQHINCVQRSEALCWVENLTSLPIEFLSCQTQALHIST